MSMDYWRELWRWLGGVSVEQKMSLDLDKTEILIRFDVSDSTHRASFLHGHHRQPVDRTHGDMNAAC